MVGVALCFTRESPAKGRAARNVSSMASGSLTVPIELYDQRGTVLRIETTANDVSCFKRHRRSLPLRKPAPPKAGGGGGT